MREGRVANSPCNYRIARGCCQPHVTRGAEAGAGNKRNNIGVPVKFSCSTRPIAFTQSRFRGDSSPELYAVGHSSGSSLVRVRETNEEAAVATRDSSRNFGSERMGPSIQGAAILLAIYILTYFAVAGILHVTATDAAIAEPDQSLTFASTAAAPNPPVSADRSPPSSAFDQDSKPAESLR
jgi:hypothetical protein